MRNTIARLAFAGAAVALAAPAPTLAGSGGFSTSLSRVENFEGRVVPEVVIVTDAGRRSLDRRQLESAVTSSLRRVRVSPDTIAVQSVATAALQFAEAQDMGVQTMCWESWCARVSVQGSGN